MFESSFVMFVCKTKKNKKKKNTRTHPWAKPFDCFVLGSYFMKINNIWTKWIVKTYSMWEKYLHILYHSINKSKIYPKCTKPPNSIGRIRTAYLLCIRNTLETAALRIIWSFSREGPMCVPEVQICAAEWVSDPRRVFQIHKKSWMFTTDGSKKKVHASNPLNGPYSAHILWKLMTV